MKNRVFIILICCVILVVTGCKNKIEQEEIKENTHEITESIEKIHENEQNTEKETISENYENAVSIEDTKEEKPDNNDNYTETESPTAENINLEPTEETTFDGSVEHKEDTTSEDESDSEGSGGGFEPA